MATLLSRARSHRLSQSGNVWWEPAWRNSSASEGRFGGWESVEE